MNDKISLILRSTLHVLGFLPQKYIIFESVPDLSDSTKAVFDEMVNRGLNEKYTMVWLLCGDSVHDYPSIKNTIYLPHRTTLIGKCRNVCCKLYYYSLAKASICCNRFIVPTNPKATTFYIPHGIAVKVVSTYYHPPKNIQYYIEASEKSAELFVKQFNVPRDNVVALGLPRNDALCLDSLDLHDYFPNYSFRKVIVWYPTYRQHKGGRKTGSTHALPIIWDDKRAALLNDYAKKNEILIVLKPHFAQDVRVIKEMQFSNLVFIDDSFFWKNGIASYRFVGSCDALLTDYSSIYYDYTLCDKPIGLIWEDYDEFAKTPGFVVDMNEAMKGAEKLYTIENLLSFVQAVASGVDRLKKERHDVRDLYQYSIDGKNTERVVDFIINKAIL